MNTGSQAGADFSELTPDRVLHLVEATLNTRCGNICRPMNSYINRVYEVFLETGEGIIIKFYRPGRWSLQALQDEHTFTLELAKAEVPVVAPLVDKDGISLHQEHGIYFALFEKMGGRIIDEPDEDQWRALGRLAGRMHSVGDHSEPVDRIWMDPEHSMADQVDELLDSGCIAHEHYHEYADAAHASIDLITDLFEGLELTRLHGDLHFQNILYRPEGFHLIDFDDMCTGPSIQDLWMLLPGRLKDCRREMDLLLQGYRLFRPFSQQELILIEPLRIMRFIHYTAWCARQAADGGFARLEPDWGSARYWLNEIRELCKQQDEIRDALARQ